MAWRRALMGWACAGMFAVCSGGAVWAQGTGDASSLPDTAAAGPNADNLDSLLNLAEKDATQLSNVKVGSAPSLDVEVSTVSRQKSTVGKSPAAVFVITNDMIRRSGARSIPEALRLAPGVAVTKIDSSKWAISIRGGNDRFANKLLVQIDGRTVYTPLFGGVFWDVQDVLLEDVERIEVIRGPGATVWGANAVNGVINVITKRSSDTQGAFGEVGGGTEERAFGSARYGGQLGQNATYRVYGKWFERDEGIIPGQQAADQWQMGRGGYRVDWNASDRDVVTIQGDAYDGVAGQRGRLAAPTSPLTGFAGFVNENHDVAGWNNLVRWTRTLDDDSDWSLQAYFDRTERFLPVTGFREDRDTVDVDFQNRFRLAERHKLIWGFGYRNTRDQIRNSLPISFTPDRRADDLFSYFVQDEISLREDILTLTLGAKFQHNDYTQFEMQPTGRLLWTPSDKQSIWASLSRAMRTPTRAESDVTLITAPEAVPFPPGLAFGRISGNRALVSEELIAYELGMRVQATENFSWDVAAFVHDYDNVILGGPPVVGFPVMGLPLPVVTQPIINADNVRHYGFEFFTNWEVTEAWRLYAAYSMLQMEQDVSRFSAAPRNIFLVQSGWDLGSNWKLDVIWRYVDTLYRTNIPSYNVADVRIAWQPRPHTELFLVGRNLFQPSHFEFANDTQTGVQATEVQHEIYGGAAFRY